MADQPKVSKKGKDEVKEQRKRLLLYAHLHTKCLRPSLQYQERLAFISILKSFVENKLIACTCEGQQEY